MKTGAFTQTHAAVKRMTQKWGQDLMHCKEGTAAEMHRVIRRRDVIVLNYREARLPAPDPP